MNKKPFFCRYTSVVYLMLITWSHADLCEMLWVCFYLALTLIRPWVVCNEKRAKYTRLSGHIWVHPPVLHGIMEDPRPFLISLVSFRAGVPTPLMQFFQGHEYLWSRLIIHKNMGGKKIALGAGITFPETFLCHLYAALCRRKLEIFCWYLSLKESSPV